MMQSKRQRILAATEAGDWRRALGLAATVSRRRLGEHAAAIQRGHEAHWQPEWCRQLQLDPAADIEAGKLALIEASNIRRTP